MNQTNSMSRGIASPNGSGQVWLNVGSSYYVEDGFINLDNSIFLLLMPAYPLLRRLLRPGHRALFTNFREARQRGVVVRHDCRTTLPYADNSVDHILCSHFLEHVYPSEAEAIVSDFHRVLRKGGTLHVIVPSLDSMVEQFARGAADGGAADSLIRDTLLTSEKTPSLRYRVLELLGFEGMKHRWMYTRASMTTRLTEAGFAILPTNDSPSAHVRADDQVTNLHLLAEKV